MSLPEQIRRQVEQANALMSQQAAPDNAPPADAAEPPAAEPAPAPAEPQAPAAAPVAASPTPAEPVTHVDDENGPTYAQRWRSLQGVYNATKRDLDTAAQRIANLEQLVSSMQTAKVDSSIPTPARHVTDKDQSEYGADMIEFARRVTREEVAPLAQAVRGLLDQIKQLQGVVPVVQRVEATQAQTAEESFYNKLDARVSDWRVVNNDVRFHDWLLATDPVTGIVRQVALEDAHARLDVDRVVNIFAAGKQAIGVATPAAPTAADPAAAQRASNVSKLERQVAPGRASAGSVPPAPKAAKTWTRAEISKFYADRQRGVYKGREAESAALEQDIFKAQAEGRIVANAA